MARSITRTVGSGITRRKKAQRVLDPTEPPDMRELASFFTTYNANLHLPWGSYGDVIQAVRTHLADLKSKVPKPQTDLDAYNRAFRERETEGWYLQHIAIEADVAEAAVRDGRPWEAVTAAMKIGEALAELRLKLDWEAFALSGQAWTEAHQRGGAETRKAGDDERKALMSEIIGERGNGVRDAARIAANRRPDMGSESSFRRSFYKKPSNPSD